MKTISRYLFLPAVISLLTFGLGQAQEKEAIQYIYKNWADQNLLKHASVGFYAIDAKSGELLAKSAPQQSLVPASTMKLVTTAAAMELLGPDYRFETTLAYQGEIKNDTLFGDLVLIGGGDPALGSNYFAGYPAYANFLPNWASDVKNRHINHITGNIRVDASAYDDMSIPGTWIWEDIGNYYGAGAFGLSIYDNTFEIHFLSPKQAGEQTSIKYTTPNLPDITFDNRVRSSDENRDNAYIFGSPLEPKRLIRGTIPKGRNDFAVKASIPNPPLMAGLQLQKALEQKAIAIDGEVICAANSKKNMPTSISVLQSPTLAKIVEVTNHESVNLFAEHLLRQIAFEKTGRGSTDAGTRLVNGFWKEKGMDTRGLFITDGSGLSHFNGITAEQLVFVLGYMKNRSANNEAFFGSLPAVPEGTLWYFNHVSFPKQSLLAKSGSMTRIRCFAGQLTTRSNKEILFAIQLNNFDCSQGQAIKAIEQLLQNIRNQ
ncbi:MAG: D-alanyl-D-alanine carboxypeptidase/D-alanyl-D-alanine-endopeptidase [Mangrovibacterium sp.]